MAFASRHDTAFAAGDIGDDPLAFRIDRAGKPLAGFRAAKNIARRMAFAAMAGAFGQILAALDLFGWVFEGNTGPCLKNRNFQPPSERRMLKGNGSS